MSEDKQPEPQAPKAEKKPPLTAKTAAPFVAASEARFAASVEYTYPLTSYTVQSGTPLEHVLRPAYWANVRQLRAGCRIWCHWEDDSMVAELLVRQVGLGFAKVVLLRTHALETSPAELPGDDYRIEWVSTVTKHRVLRNRDNMVLKDKLETLEDAQAWLRQHRKLMAAA